MIDSLQIILTEIGNKLEGFDLLRENIIQSGRKLNRISASGISLLVKMENPKANYEEAIKLFQEIKKLYENSDGYIVWNTIYSELEEFAEFMLLYGIIIEQRIIPPSEFEIPITVWLTGLADTVGEIRRILLRLLIDEQLDSVKLYYSIFSEISHAMRGMVYSKSLVPNLRRKLDVLRAITEKTDSDITNSLLIMKFNKNLEANKS